MAVRHRPRAGAGGDDALGKGFGAHQEFPPGQPAMAMLS
ncbi:hypothetical protein I552_6081 [Mycobacterium xenopi 3993]|nr:hypothetical protein I552_6081 [Mycobacterium xenopi 3993]